MHEYDYVSEEMLCVLAQAIGEENVLMTEPMSRYTTFEIGGPADVVCTPRTPEDAVRVLDICLTCGVPLTVVGNGSDLLVGDRGIRGAVLLLRGNLAKIEVIADRVRAQAGALMRDVALAAADAGLSGLEPLWGIPASVGGACFMNAGAYDKSISDVLECIHAYVPGAQLPDGTRAKGEVRRFDAAELAMGYRSSRVNADGLIVLDAVFKLTPDDPDTVRSFMETYRVRREEKQPLDMPSAGSTFKRPEGHFAGKLIMDAGLAGRRVGGAEVSPKHCGFVVNADHATASDVRTLIAQVQDEVREKFGVELEPEVRMVGEF